MRWTVVVVTVWLAGCDALFQLDTIELRDGSTEDSSSDASFSHCFGHDFAAICLQTEPSGVLSLPTMIDTTTCSGGTVAQPVSQLPIVCVFAADTINIGMPLRVTGTLPLVLIAKTSIEVDQTIDVGSMIGNPGPGASPSTTCKAPGGTTGTVGAGAAGGEFGGDGGNGGASALSAGATGRQALALGKIRTGCAGGKGGDGTLSSGGPGGRPGGIIYLITLGPITIASSGAILAGGEGGRTGGASKGGGGGGGAGGLIGLDAPVINSLGTICANGGAGGGAAGGGPGGDGCSRGIGAAMPGGTGVAAGGTGSTNATPPRGGAAPGNMGGAGGGGGGAGGYIHVSTETPPSLGTHSPPAL